MHRILIFCDCNTHVTARLVRTTLRLAKERRDIEVVGFCSAHPQKFRRPIVHYLRSLAYHILIKLFSPYVRKISRIPYPIDLRRFGLKLLNPPEGNVNHPDFIQYLRTAIKPTLALSYYSLSIFSEELLGIFEHAVNYHNGELPNYRGLNATRWSIYNGEKSSGFTFHRMVSEIDKGAVLLKGSVAVQDGESAVDLEYRKTSEAIKLLPQLFDKIERGEVGQAMEGKGSYFSQHALDTKTIIDDPQRVTSTEYQRRLAAFETLYVYIDGNKFPITELREFGQKVGQRRKLSITTSDNITLKPIKFRYVPYWLFKVINAASRVQIKG